MNDKEKVFWVKEPDMVEVVRCKDCIHFIMMEDGYHDCINIYGIDFPQPDDFCSYGEKNK